MKVCPISVFFSLVLLLFSGGCIDEVALETLNPVGFSLEDVLVVDARITNESKRQRILLSRPSTLSADSTYVGVSGATVTVSSSEGNTYNFEEMEPAYTFPLKFLPTFKMWNTPSKLSWRTDNSTSHNQFPEDRKAR